MSFSVSRESVPWFRALAEVGSTNDALSGWALEQQLPDFSVVVTTNQTVGRGRLDRQWVAPDGQALAVSVLLHPILSDGTAMPTNRFGWIPLLAGLAMTRAVRALVGGHQVGLKWPNDVLIDGRKVSGILTELLPNGAGIIVGAGLNLSIPQAELPVSTATSLSLHGVEVTGELPDMALAAYLRELTTLWIAFGADAATGGIRRAVIEECSTLGQPVQVSLPGGAKLRGTAVDLDSEGRLRIRTTTDSSLQTVAAGDVTHLRYE